jgi:hypothetical protein
MSFLIWLLIYLLIGFLCVVHITGIECKKHPETFKSRVSAAKCLGVSTVLGFMLLWPFGLDFIFLKD